MADQLELWRKTLAAPLSAQACREVIALLEDAPHTLTPKWAGERMDFDHARIVLQQYD